MAENIIIIGGGLIGLAVGCHLLDSGRTVLILEKETAGSGASSKAAGMITPASEVRYGEEKLLSLFLESAGLYPDFIGSVEAASQTKADYRRKGSLLVAVDRDDEAELTRLHDYQRHLGLNPRFLSKDETLKLEPHLSSHFVSSVYAENEAFLDNNLLVQALKEAFLKKGGTLREKTGVLDLTFENERITGVKIAEGVLNAEKVLLASGNDVAFPSLEGKLALPLRPVKGQALEVLMPPGVRLTHAVRTLHRYPVYLVPRSDGRMVIGATLEEMGVNPDLTAGAQMDLIYGAWKIFPAVYEAPIVRTWVGFRPTSRDHLPILGPTKIKGLSLALGMYRHGVLLTPVIARLLGEWMAEEKYSSYFDEFGIGRFAVGAIHELPQGGS